MERRPENAPLQDTLGTAETPHKSDKAPDESCPGALHFDTAGQGWDASGHGFAALTEAQIAEGRMMLRAHAQRLLARGTPSEEVAQTLAGKAESVGLNAADVARDALTSTDSPAEGSSASDLGTNPAAVSP